jgi:hypothetical protein
VARKTVPGVVQERIENRLALTMQGAETGNDAMANRVKDILWTLHAVGFEDDLVTEMLTAAADIAGFDSTVVAKYNTKTAQRTGKRGGTNGNAATKS